MKISRRGVIAGLAVAGAALPGGAWLKWKNRPAPEEETEPEPPVEAPAVAEAVLAEGLRGIWRWRFLSRPPGSWPVSSDDLQLLLDSGQDGRSLVAVLFDPAQPAWACHLRGELDSRDLPRLRLRLETPQGQVFECRANLDEAWGQWSAGGGVASLSGELTQLEQQPGHSADTTTWVAHRQPFIEARDRRPLNAELLAWLASPGHRLFHQAWHAVRDYWHRLPQDKRHALKLLGWQPGGMQAARGARGTLRHCNGSGEDFLFMHRRMLMQARAFQALPSWRSFPLPCPFLGYGRQAFIDYQQNTDGFSVPPAWASPWDPEFNSWLLGVKGRKGFFANFQLWEAQFQNPDYLATLTLGELGSRIELGLHDWLHMRWASICRDPNSGLPMIHDKPLLDHAERWFQRRHDYLADAFSSHVHPVFWSFHGWIDDRIDDWFLAHQRRHPGQVRRTLLNQVPWFSPGPWVTVSNPWLGPEEQGCGAWMKPNLDPQGLYDIDTMRLALTIANTGDAPIENVLKRVPQRPWYARHLVPGAAPLPR